MVKSQKVGVKKSQNLLVSRAENSPQTKAGMVVA